jgi:5'-nucleotidase
MEAVMLGVPAIAFSSDPGAPDYRPAAAYAQRLARVALKRGLPPGVCLNVNFPLAPKGGYKAAEACRLGRRIYGTDVTRRKDPRGIEYFWLAGQQVRGVEEPGTDVGAVARGRVSATPLLVDNTDGRFLGTLKSWPL